MRASRNAAAKHILDAAKADPEAGDHLDTSQVSDLDLARWILSIRESAADEADAKEAGSHLSLRRRMARSL